MAAIDGLPLYSLVVRADLRKNISRIDDLKGRRIGVHSDSPIAITTSRQILNLVLGSRGISPSEVSIIPAGQSWDSQSSVFLTRTADAIMSDEPLATRFTLEKLGGTIYSTGNKSDISTTPGAGFLRATLIARRDKVERNSELSMRMVKVVQRSLAYMASRKAPELADLMALQGAERLSFINVFEKFPDQYSHDAKFSRAQLKDTEIFTRHANPGIAGVLQYAVDQMVIDRWAGSKP